jgi:isopenicillin N synthase-like dioxygenase
MRHYTLQCATTVIMMGFLPAGAELPRSEQLSCGEHTDYGMLTIVSQDPGVAALQVKNAAGAWITAAPIPGALVCNIGDMMRVWTNGLYKPTLHRVVNPSRDRSRVSIPYFHEPGFDTTVQPILGLHGSSLPPRVASRHYGSHLESKVFSNFEL